jgi:SAM-dependent methyltransferase
VDQAAFEWMASREADHWWYVGRRAAIAALLDRLPLTDSCDVLEAGCGTGGNLYMLQRRGRVSAFEPSEFARAIAGLRSTFPTTVADGELPDRLPFGESSFDVVLALDVLEHVDRDADAVRSLVRLARPGGYVVLTVPAHPILFGRHDIRFSHVRRYSRGAFKALCAATGSELRYFTAFNTILGPVAVALRLLERVLPLRYGTGNPPEPFNSTLAWLFSLEGAVLRRWSLPAGLSYAAILRRPEA